MLKAVLFDMDGLIFDTESMAKQSWQFAAIDQGLVLSDEQYQQFIGTPGSECEEMVAKLFNGKIDMERYKRVRNDDLHNRREKGISLKPGFNSLFTAIEQCGLKIALVTSSPLSDVEHNFQNIQVLDKFNTIVTAENVRRGKPNPECYQLACKQLGLLPQECLVLEDSNNGVRAGIGANCHAIMIPDLLPPAKDVEHVLQVSTLEDVIPYLDKF